jgi:HSP20 family molecular chaperone IbpA
MSFPPPPPPLLDALLLPPELVFGDGHNVAARMFAAGASSLSSRSRRRRMMPSSHPAAAALRIHESDSSIRLTMDLPGIRAKDIDVSVQHGVLLIQGCRVERDLNGNIYKKQKVAQRFSIDTHVVDVTKAVANLSQGVLVIQAPKKGRPVAVQIPVTECDNDGLVVVDDDDEEEEEATVPSNLVLAHATGVATTTTSDADSADNNNNQERAVQQTEYQHEFENHPVHDTESSEQSTLSAGPEGSAR